MSSPEMSEDEEIDTWATSQINVSIHGQQIIQAAEGQSLREPVCVGGTQIIETQDRSKQRPKERWNNEVSINIQGKIWTSVCTDIKYHLQINSVANIIGSPGEGKTTLANLLLDDYRKQHWTFAVPQTPKEYFQLKQGHKTIILLNDILGAFEFEKNQLIAWLPVFEDLRQRLDNETTDNPNISQSYLKVIFVHRDYIWREAESKLGKYINNIFKDEHICDVSVSKKLTEMDKLQLVHTNEKKHKQTLSTLCVQELVDADIPHGFPFCCEMLFFLPDALKNPLEFFTSPIPFLNETMIQFCHDNVKHVVICLLLKYGGRIMLKVINSKETMENELFSLGLQDSSQMTTNRFHCIKNAFKYLCGSYLKQEKTWIEFSHASVLQSAAVSMGMLDIEFLIMNCDFVLLKDMLKPHHYKDKQSAGLHNRYVIIDESNMDLAVNRYVLELCRGHVLNVLSSNLLEDEGFVKRFCDQIQGLPNNLFMFRDTKSGSFLFYLAAQCNKPFVLKELMSTDKLNSKSLSEAVFGCCEYGNTQGLKMLLQNHHHLYMLNRRNEKKETPLLCAAKNEHMYVCQLLLLYDINVSAQDKDGNTALHLAAERGNIDVVESLIHKSKKLDIRNKHKQTGLHTALLGGHSKTAKLLLENGADFTVKEKMGLTPLHCASFTGLTDIVSYLIEKGADLNELNNRGSPAVIKAAEGGHVDIVKFLHGNGCNINQANRMGFTSFHLACDRGHVEVVKLLIHLGCDINVRSKVGATGLMLASRCGRTDVVEVISNGCDLDICDGFGRSAMVYAIMGLNEDVALLLLDKGCRVDMQCVISFRSLIELISTALDGGSLGRILEKLSSVYWILDSVQQEMSLNALHFAAMTCQIDLVVTLLDRGLDVNISYDGITPVEMFCYILENISFLRLLLRFRGENMKVPDIHSSKFAPVVAEMFRRGADINRVDARGANDLHHAAGVGSVELMEVLLEAGFTIDKVDLLGQTPLHYAAWNGKTDAVQYLLENNADPHLAQDFYQTALHFALLRGHHDVADLLMSKGCCVRAPIRLLYRILFRVLLILGLILAVIYW